MTVKIITFNSLGKLATELELLQVPNDLPERTQLDERQVEQIFVAHGEAAEQFLNACENLPDLQKETMKHEETLNTMNEEYSEKIKSLERLSAQLETKKPRNILLVDPLYRIAKEINQFDNLRARKHEVSDKLFQAHNECGEKEIRAATIKWQANQVEAKAFQALGKAKIAYEEAREEERRRNAEKERKLRSIAWKKHRNEKNRKRRKRKMEERWAKDNDIMLESVRLHRRQFPEEYVGEDGAAGGSEGVSFHFDPTTAHQISLSKPPTIESGESPITTSPLVSELSHSSYDFTDDITDISD